jgi:hypothetical protein
LSSVTSPWEPLPPDLLVAVKHEDDLYQASDNEGVLLVDVPDVVAQKALAANMSVREYVRVVIKKFSSQSDERRMALIKLLESDDLVVVKVRERLAERTTEEIAVELEKCMCLPEEEDRVFAVKNMLAANVKVAERNRGDSSDEVDKIDLLDLAEELLEKLADIYSGFLLSQVQEK